MAGVAGKNPGVLAILQHMSGVIADGTSGIVNIVLFRALETGEKKKILGKGKHGALLKSAVGHTPCHCSSEPSWFYSLIRKPRDQDPDLQGYTELTLTQRSPFQLTPPHRLKPSLEAARRARGTGAKIPLTKMLSTSLRNLVKGSR
eukprot:scaffold8186_cov59-Phaeocystis_antarctica.AAC.1